MPVIIDLTGTDDEEGECEMGPEKRRKTVIGGSGAVNLVAGQRKERVKEEEEKPDVSAVADVRVSDRPQLRLTTPNLALSPVTKSILGGMGWALMREPVLSWPSSFPCVPPRRPAEDVQRPQSRPRHSARRIKARDQVAAGPS